MRQFQGPDVVRAGSLTWLAGTLNGSKKSVMSFVINVLFLLGMCKQGLSHFNILVLVSFCQSNVLEVHSEK